MDLKSCEGYLRSAFRRVWRWHDGRIEAIRASKVDKLHKCAACARLVPKTEIKADHISPVVDPKTGEKQVNGHIDWNDKFERMFVPASGLQMLCDTCHDRKTLSEQKERRDAKRKKL